MSICVWLIGVCADTSCPTPSGKVAPLIRRYGRTSKLGDRLIEHAQGRAFIGDTAYDSAQIRTAARQRGMKVVIPSHPTRAIVRRYDKPLGRIRYRVECFFHDIKRCRRIATRYEKSARNYLALVHLACTLEWLR